MSERPVDVTNPELLTSVPPLAFAGEVSEVAGASRVARLAGIGVAWALLVVADLWLRRDIIASAGRLWPVRFAIAAFGSLVLWLAVVDAINALRRKSGTLGVLATGIVAVGAPLCAFGTILYTNSFHMDPRPIQFAYLLENARYLSSLIAVAIGKLGQIALMSAPIPLFALVRWASKGSRLLPDHAVPRRFAVVAAIAVISIAWMSGRRAFRTWPLLADQRGLVTVVQGTWRRLQSAELPTLPLANRSPLPPVTATDRPDVILFVNESISAKQLAPWAPESTSDPALAAFLHDHADHSVWFPRATAAANSTMVALPTLLSGIATDSSRADFARAPLLWHEARARGYQTALLSAQDYNYGFFRGLIIGDDGPDLAMTADEFKGEPRVNDRGVRDGVAIDRAIRFVDETPHDKPILLVVQFNATHFPGWAPGYAWALRADFATVRERSDAATRYLDGEVERLLSHLAQRGRLEESLIVSTSDHGESLRADSPLRVTSYREDAMSVPLWVHVPESLVAKHPDWPAKLAASASRRVSNLDIFPTLLDVWGSAGPETDRPALGGVSLLRAPDEDRSLLVFGSNTICEAVAEGFAFYHGRWKWRGMEETGGGLQLFDVGADPLEHDDLSSSAPEEERALLLAVLHAHPVALPSVAMVSSDLAARALGDDVARARGQGSRPSPPK